MNHRLFVQLTVAACVLIASLIAYGIALHVVDQAHAQVAQLTNEVQQKSTDTSKTALAKSELNALATDEATIHQYFVSNDNVVPYLEGLQKTGSYFGSTIKVVSVSAEPDSPFGHLDLSVSISGTFTAVMRTLGAIEYQPYDTALKSVTIDSTPSTDATAPTAWTATAVFTIGTQGETTPAT